MRRAEDEVRWSPASTRARAAASRGFDRSATSTACSTVRLAGAAWTGAAADRAVASASAASAGRVDPVRFIDRRSR